LHYCCDKRLLKLSSLVMIIRAAAIWEYGSAIDHDYESER